MKVQVLGTGCAKCKQLTANVQEAARQGGLAVEIEKVEGRPRDREVSRDEHAGAGDR